MTDSNPTVPYSLNNPVPARRGSVSPRLVKCGKASCPCAHDPKARHGPYFSYTHAVNGRTQSRFLSEEEAAVVRRQIERGQQFHSDVGSFWKLCEQAADKELDDLQAASPEAAKKGGSKRRSKRSSRLPPSRKSKRS
jgi:hypothetical protein